MGGDGDMEKGGFSGLSDLASDVSTEDNDFVPPKPSAPPPKPSQQAPAPVENRKPEQPASHSTQTVEPLGKHKDRNRFRGIWIFGIFLAIIVVWASIDGAKNTKKRSYNHPPTAQSSNPQRKRSNLNGGDSLTQDTGPEYEKPPVSKNHGHSLAQIRWCVREAIRIETVRYYMDSSDREAVEEFIKFVKDYNLRCASYRYRRGSLKRAQDEVEANRNQIENEAIRYARKLGRTTQNSYSTTYSQKPSNNVAVVPAKNSYSNPATITTPEKTFQASNSAIIQSNLRKARLFVEAEPKDSRIRVMNIKPKFYQGMQLRPGRYHLETSKKGYETQKEWIELHAGEDKRLEVGLEQLQISIQSTATNIRRLSPTSNIIKRDGIYVDYANGVVKDTNTGLEWKVGPDKNTTWDKARAWVQSLNLDGGGWRMPIAKELKTLYHKGAGPRNRTSLLKASGWGVWSGEFKGSLQARLFNFYAGDSYWCGHDDSNDKRAFAVRSRGDR
jgi:hypothetical protein